MNSINPVSKKRNPPKVTWQDSLDQAKRRAALLHLLADEGSCPVAFCLEQIPKLTKTDIQAMRGLGWIGAYVTDDALYLRDAGRALLAGEGDQ